MGEEVGNGRGFADTRKLDALIFGRGFRFCAGCGIEVALEEPTPEEAHRQPFTCERCSGLDVGPVARRRYLEHEAKKRGGLERAEARMRRAKAGLERMVGEEDVKTPSASDSRAGSRL